jgi:hypothetical protein
MEILVDYDNLERDVARAGMFALCTRLGVLIGQRRTAVPDRCRVRLYGGWYENKQFTRAAEKLIADIDQVFPDAIAWQTKENPGKCLTQAELAVSLQADPGRHLFHTFRERKFCAQLKCDTTYFDGCNEQYCPMREVADFLYQQKCPNYTCRVSQADVLSKGEQKLIDTMITSDMIFLATQGEQDIVVISSDDDIWPGVRTAVQLGAQVTLVQTKSRETPIDYTRGVTGLDQLFL